MHRRQMHFSNSFRSYRKGAHDDDKIPQIKKKNGIESGSDSGCLEICENEKKKFYDLHDDRPVNLTSYRAGGFSGAHGRLPKIINELPSPRGFPKMKTWKLSQNGNLTLNEGSVLPSLCLISTLSLTSVPYLSKKRGYFLGLKKKKKNERKLQYHSGVTAGKLQTQVNDLLEKVTEKSIDLLAQKLAELQQCEFLGEERLQSSRHFQLASKRTMRMYKCKHMHFRCTCCC
uniref:Uncharacterized protein n=1 Tax=Chelonoidis abingdonii TaxID=106734 RepID=A0A8C0J2L0_CHEAB